MENLISSTKKVLSQFIDSNYELLTNPIDLIYPISNEDIIYCTEFTSNKNIRDNILIFCLIKYINSKIKEETTKYLCLNLGVAKTMIDEISPISIELLDHSFNYQTVLDTFTKIKNYKYKKLHQKSEQI